MQWGGLDATDNAHRSRCGDGHDVRLHVRQSRLAKREHISSQLVWQQNTTPLWWARNVSTFSCVLSMR